MRTTCRISGEPLLPVADLGDLYVSDFFSEVTEDAERGPLKLGLGEESGVVQLFDTVDSDSLYRHYWYRSGVNSTMSRQLSDVVGVVPHWVRLADGDIVLDIGCNDGTLLGHYTNDVKLLKVGIDPAENMAEPARKICDLHSVDYFTGDGFLSLSGGLKAKVITSIAMFYDLDDPHTFVADVRRCLDDSGIWIVQLSYTPLMVKQNAFDNICHEHVEYYTLLSMKYLLELHDIKIVDVELNNTNSGSFRIVAMHASNQMSEANLFDRDIGEYRFNSLLSHEAQLGVDKPRFYQDFKNSIDDLKAKTLDFLEKLAREGKKVYGYGASTKGNTLLQYYGIGPELISHIADRQPQKNGLLTSGSWIPIISEEEAREAKPDYMFVLPWHFINEFRHREREFLRSGGKFIVPLPELKVIGQ